MKMFEKGINVFEFNNDLNFNNLCLKTIILKLIISCEFQQHHLWAIIMNYDSDDRHTFIYDIYCLLLDPDGEMSYITFFHVFKLSLTSFYEN